MIPRLLAACAIVLLIVALWSGVAIAQTSDQSDPPAPRFGAEVLVTPERGETPRERASAATAVVDAESIAPLPATDLGEIVSFLPGFAVMRPHFHHEAPIVSARGFFGGGEAEYLLLLVDGIPQSDAESGLIDWSVFPTAAIRRIEAVRGPAASLYGDSAIGGVIHLQTDRRSTGGAATATAGSFGTFGADGSYGRRTTRTGVLVAGSVRRTAGGIDHTEGRQYAGMGGLEGVRGRLSWHWTINGDTRSRETQGALSRPAFALDPYAADPMHALDEVDRQRGSTSLTLRYDARVFRPVARVHASVRDEDRIRTIPLAPGIGDRQARALETRSIGASLEAAASRGTARPVSILMGLDLAREVLDTSYRPVASSGGTGPTVAEISGVRRRAGLFAASGWDVARRIRLSGAVRWDHVDDEDFEAAPGDAAVHRAWTARGGVVVSLRSDGGVSLFSQVSRAFKAPTLEQLFDPRPYPDFAGGSFTISNRRLMPQYASNVEAGISGSGRVSWSALAYHMDVEDEIDFDLRTFSYANIGRSNHRGLELEASVATPRVHPSVTYTLTHASGESGRQLKNVPRHALAVSARIDLGPAGGAFVRYQHSRGAFLDDESAYRLEGPSTLDVRLRRAIGRYAVFVDGLNLTRDTYEEFGFTLTDFAGQPAPYVYAGSPRAFRAGVTVGY